MCDAETIARLVDPILADFQHEARTAERPGMLRSALLRARWAAALGSALAVAFVRTPLTPDERGARRRIVAGTIAGGAVLTVLQLAPSIPRVFQAIQQTRQPWIGAALIIALLPMALSVTIPLGTLLGTLGVSPGSSLGGRIRWRSLVGVALATTALTALTMVCVPYGNQEFRSLLYSAISDTTTAVPPGPNEMSLAELRTVAKRSELSGDPKSAARHWRALHQRFAIPVTCVVFVWLGAVLSATRIGRSRVRRALAVAGVLLGYYLAVGVGAAKSATFSISPVVGVWLPNAALAAVAAVLTIRSLRLRARGCAHA